jgi:hypothetical protein
VSIEDEMVINDYCILARRQDLLRVFILLDVTPRQALLTLGKLVRLEPQDEHACT